MNNDLIHARSLLKEGSFTCVLCCADTVRTSSKRGIAPLLDFMGTENFAGFSAADKVVGKATAFLYVLLGVRAVYAPIMSSPAIRILKEHHIECVCDTAVDAIRNRTGSGFCPMETAVREIEEPSAALLAVRTAMNELQNQK